MDLLIRFTFVKQMDYFVNYNGNILSADQPLFTAANRAFRYGDAVFETIRMMHGEILFFEKHLDRLQRSMKLLRMDVNSDLDFHKLYLAIRHLDQSNRLGGNGRVRLEVFRNDGGLYTPQSNAVSYLIEASPLNGKEYILNETGLKIEVYTDIKKPVSRLSNLKSANALYYVMAGLHKRENGLDDCLVLNTDDNIAEAISSNIFLVKGEQLITPGLDQACVAGVMREFILQQATENNIPVVESAISIDDMLIADEVFLTDVIHGIRWVSAFRNKRYFNTRSRQLLQSINVLHARKD